MGFRDPKKEGVDLSGYVPYTGATADLNLGDFNLLAEGAVSHDSHGFYFKNQSLANVASFGLGGGQNWTFYDGVKLDSGTASRVLVTDASKNIGYATMTASDLDGIPTTYLKLNASNGPVTDFLKVQDPQAVTVFTNASTAQGIGIGGAGNQNYSLLQFYGDKAFAIAQIGAMQSNSAHGAYEAGTTIDIGVLNSYAPGSMTTPLRINPSGILEFTSANVEFGTLYTIKRNTSTGYYETAGAQVGASGYKWFINSTTELARMSVNQHLMVSGRISVGNNFVENSARMWVQNPVNQNTILLGLRGSNVQAVDAIEYSNSVGTVLMRLNASGYGGFGSGIGTVYHPVQTFGIIKAGGNAGQQYGIVALGDDLSANYFNGIYRTTSTAGALTGGNWAALGGYDGVHLTTGNALFGAQTPRLSITNSNGYVGINMTAPTFRLSSNHSTAGTNAVDSSLLLKTTTSNDMVDGFGGGMLWGIQDSAGVENLIAGASAWRDGADNSGKWGLRTWSAGSATYHLNISATGIVSIGNGQTTGTGKLNVTSTTEQLRLYYDSSNYMSMVVGSTGGVTFDAVGSGAGFTFSDSITMADAKNIIFDTTAGTKIGTANNQKLSLWNATPDIQPTSAITASAFVTNTSGIVDDTATFGGYTIGQIVASLLRLGALA